MVSVGAGVIAGLGADDQPVLALVNDVRGGLGAAGVAGILAAAPGQNAQEHRTCYENTCKLFHVVFLLSFFTVDFVYMLIKPQQA